MSLHVLADHISSVELAAQARLHLLDEYGSLLVEAALLTMPLGVIERARHAYTGDSRVRSLAALIQTLW